MTKVSLLSLFGIFIWFILLIFTNGILGFFFEFNRGEIGASGYSILLYLLAYQNFLNVYVLKIYTVYFHLTKLNEYVETFKDFNEEKIREGVKIVSIILGRVSDVLEPLKIFYTINLLAYLFYSTFYIILGIYAQLSFIFRDNKPGQLFWNLTIVVWNIYYIPFLTSIFLIANWIRTESLRIEDKAQKCLTKKSTSNLKYQKQLEIFHLELSHRRPEISCGFFVIDWKFLFSCMAAAFSYIIIIVQFEFKTFQE